MTETIASDDETREATTDICVPVVKTFAVCGQRVWDGFCSAARLVVIWFIMLGLPLVYEKRLTVHLWNLRGPLAFQELTARAQAFGIGGVAMHLLDESELQVSKRFIKRCVVEWRVFVTISVVILGLATALLPSLNGQLLTRSLLYTTFACELLAFVIGTVYSVQLEHVQDTQVCSLWLWQASRDELLIEFHAFLALPLTWSIWGLLLFTSSLVSFIWTYPGELTTPSAEIQSVLETWRFRWITSSTAVFVVGLWNCWLLWVVFSQLSKFEIDAPAIQAPASGTERTVLENTGSVIL